MITDKNYESKQLDKIYDDCKLQVQKVKIGNVSYCLQTEIYKHEELLKEFETIQAKEIAENKKLASEISQKFIDKYIYAIQILKNVQGSIDLMVK